MINLNIQTLAIATHNTAKYREFSALLSPIHCVSQSQLGINCADETGLSFIENAIIKARHASRYAHQPALADDSGLVVDALKGKPGIYSARFAGPKATDEDNVQLLLKQLSTVPDEQRQAHFFCALALVQHADDPCPIIAMGSCHGFITQMPVGHHGFGYDPVFYLPQYQCTMAELPLAVKNTISHRAIAIKRLQQQLK